MKIFFQTLPTRLKVILHLLELLLSLYATTAITLIATPLGVHLTKYLPTIAISFLVGYPFVRFLIECTVGVTGTSPQEVDPLSEIKKANSPH